MRYKQNKNPEETARNEICFNLNLDILQISLVTNDV